ncbi:MAG: hypothetical protein OEZ36_05265, partial [Spirochaetota bacterium]|nr:hypothetical protein [Spirochaetota bacterium]
IDIKSYNWANPSTKYIHQYYKLKYYLDHKLKEKPKILLINLDVGSLKTRKINRNHYFWVKYLDYFKISKSLPSDERLKFLGNYIKALYAPYLGEHKLLYQWIKTSRKNYGKYSDKGFYLLAKKVKLSPKQKKIKNKRLRRALKNREKSLKRAKTKNKKHIQKEAKEYFIKILELCGKHNIRVMLVICPMKKDLHDMMTRYRSLTNYYAELNKIIKNYNHVELFDYMDIFFKRPDLFIDFYHLNDVGAMEFTKAINRDLTKLLAKWQL